MVRPLDSVDLNPCGCATGFAGVDGGAADWYRARLSRDEIVLKSKLSEKEIDYKIYEHRRTQATRNDDVRVRALASAADVYARTASAALSSLNSIVSTAANI